MNDTPEKKHYREEVMPKIPLTHSILVPAIKELLHDALIQTLKAEIELYKNYPKNNAKADFDKFNPRNHKTCFMSLGFIQGNGDFSDSDLQQYRKQIGTINHPVWGNCTLLEIWGGDHFESHQDMVRGVFSYCYHKRKTLPILKFESIPFIITEFTGTELLDENDLEKFKFEYLKDVNGLKTTQFGTDPYESFDDMPQGIKDDFWRIWNDKTQKKDANR